MSPRKDTSRLERFEQQDGVKLLRSLGGVVYVSGTTRRSTDYQGTMQTPGIPDVQCFLPVPYSAGLTRRLLVWEVKRATGKMSPAQESYRAWALAAGVAHVWGDVNALLRWLVAEGFVHERQLTATRQEAIR